MILLNGATLLFLALVWRRMPHDPRGRIGLLFMAAIILANFVHNALSTLPQ